MTDWDWVTGEGNVGELPVEIATGHGAEFLLDFAPGVRVRSYVVEPDVELYGGDICILTARIDEVDTSHDPTLLDVTVRDVEFVRRSERAVKGDGEYVRDQIWKNLEKARARNDEGEGGCQNCQQITADTKLTVDDDRGRDLHCCAHCGRLLSSSEYEQWKQVRHH